MVRDQVSIMGVPQAVADFPYKKPSIFELYALSRCQNAERAVSRLLVAGAEGVQ
jgi:hypothetical protein